MQEFPNKMRQYTVYEQFLESVKKYRKVNDTMAELRSDAMKSRHWKDLQTRLRIKVPFNDLSLSHLWQADLLKHNKTVSDILS